MFIHSVCQALNKAKVPYAVVGGYAVALHGAVRGTVDIDVAINWTLANLVKVERVLKELGLISRIPVEAQQVFHFKEEYIQNKNLIAWNFFDPNNPLNQVDIIINYDLKRKKVETVKSKHANIKILSRKDLILMKKASGRPQDLEDVKALENL